MPAIDDPQHAENGARTPGEIRLMALETRLTAVQVDLAVIRVSFATKDDIQRVLTLPHEHKLEFRAALNAQREDLIAALTGQREEFTTALTGQREEFTAALTGQREDLTLALTKQREDFTLALNALRQDFNAGQLQIHKSLMSHMWKLYGFASLLLGGVYFIARYVH